MCPCRRQRHTAPRVLLSIWKGRDSCAAASIRLVSQFCSRFILVSVRCGLQYNKGKIEGTLEGRVIPRQSDSQGHPAGAMLEELAKAAPYLFVDFAPTGTLSAGFGTRNKDNFWISLKQARGEESR